MFFEQMHPGWQAMLLDQKKRLEALEISTGVSLPTPALVMRVFQQDPMRVKVVILGQDPYPTPGDAVGLAFAISIGRKTPRSLTNIMMELEADLGVTVSKEADLAKWEHRGVFLLNSVLTTSAHAAGSHIKLGWQQFTETALTRLAELKPYVLLAWGNYAKTVAARLPETVKVISSAHPSPLSARRGFFGSKPFSQANQALVAMGSEPIDWST
jgi:uracil-DNA glycosylase